MATVAKRIQKFVSKVVNPSKPANRLPEVVLMDLAAGQFLPLGHNAAPPNAPKGFSPIKFTEADQKANPGKPMTRVIKDVLSVGKRKAGFDESGKPFFWDVTPQDLQLIAMCFADAQANGVAFNLTNSHGDPRTCIVPTPNIISAIDEVVVEDGVLWISSYVTPEVAIALQNPAMKVSPGIKPDFMDGEGHVYPLQLYHVAVVDNPVVPRQGAFMAMANSQGVKAMDETILDLFKQIFDYEEMPLPETVTVDNALEILPILVSQLVGSSGEEASDEEDPTEVAAGESEADSEAVDMANKQTPAWAQTLINGQKALTARLDRIESGSKRETYEAKVDSLVSARVLSNAQGVEMKAKGAASNFDTTAIDILSKGLPTISRVAPTLGRQARTLANPQAEGPAAMSGDDVKKAADELIGGEAKRRKVKPMA